MNKTVFAAIMGFAALAGVASAAGYAYRPLGVTNIKKPAQVEFLDLTVGNYSGSTLVVSQFAPFSAGDVQVLTAPGAAVSKWSAAKFQSIATGSKLKWPNLVTKVPSSIHPNAVVVADGFLVPGASDGGVYALIGDAGSWTKSVSLTTVKKGYFYHKIEFVDLNGDGKLDILTARATKSIFGSSGGELLWLENPGSLTGTWTEHVITPGPDVIFEVVELDGDDNTLDLIATQFFSSKVAAYFLSKKDGSLVDSVLIDDSIGAAYDVEIWDLNANGQKQLLINNHDGSSSKSALYAYEIPSNPKTGKWTRHTLASGFTTIASGFGQAAPGFSYGFHPKVGATNEKPYILIAGDGTKSAFLLTPDASTDFKYAVQEIVKTKGVVGSIGISDVDGDGFVEFFVPDYDGNQLYAYSFSPAQ